MLLALLATLAHAGDAYTPATAPPGTVERTFSMDTPLVRAAAQAQWGKLGRSYFWNWFRCDSTRMFVASEVNEGQDPLAAVCFEARDLSKPMQPVFLRVERTGVGRSVLRVGAMNGAADKAMANAVKAYVKAVEKDIAKANRSSSPLHDSWFRAMPSTLIPHAREALLGANEDCERRVDWLEKADPLDAATQRAIEGRIARGVDACAAAIATRRVQGHPAEGVVKLVRSAADAAVDAARGRTPPDAPGIRTMLARLSAYPAPVRDGLAMEQVQWATYATAIEEESAAKLSQDRASLSPDLQDCYKLRERARASGADLAMSVHSPVATTGQAALWLLPGPLLHTTAGEGFARVDDGNGGTSWAVVLPHRKPPGPSVHVVGTLDVATVTTPRGAQVVPLLRAECYSEELPQ